jgi:hypothetical protein
MNVHLPKGRTCKEFFKEFGITVNAAFSKPFPLQIVDITSNVDTVSNIQEALIEVKFLCDTKFFSKDVIKHILVLPHPRNPNELFGHDRFSNKHRFPIIKIHKDHSFTVYYDQSGKAEIYNCDFKLLNKDSMGKDFVRIFDFETDETTPNIIPFKKKEKEIDEKILIKTAPIIEGTLAKNQNMVDQYLNGKKEALNDLVAAAKKLDSKVNVDVARELIKQRLGKS